MKLMLEQRNVVRAILNRPGDSFVALASVAGLDPETAFREADLRGVDFGIDDLSGFDFTGADLRGANFARARGKDCAVFVDVLLDRYTTGLVLREQIAMPVDTRDNGAEEDDQQTNGLEIVSKSTHFDHESRGRLLLTCPLFDGLPHAAVDDILVQSTERLMRRGQTLFQKEDEGSYMVAVLSGRIRISATSPEGARSYPQYDRCRGSVR
jgi:hypothetical protein